MSQPSRPPRPPMWRRYRRLFGPDVRGDATALAPSVRRALLATEPSQRQRLVGAGLLLGGAIAAAAGSVVAPLLFEVSPRDPLVFGGVALALLLTGGVAAWVPSWRATRVDPATALRAE